MPVAHQTDLLETGQQWPDSRLFVSHSGNPLCPFSQVDRIKAIAHKRLQLRRLLQCVLVKRFGFELRISTSSLSGYNFICDAFGAASATPKAYYFRPGQSIKKRKPRIWQGLLLIGWASACAAADGPSISARYIRHCSLLHWPKQGQTCTARHPCWPTPALGPSAKPAWRP